MAFLNTNLTLWEVRNYLGASPKRGRIPHSVDFLATPEHSLFTDSFCRITATICLLANFDALKPENKLRIVENIDREQKKIQK